MRMGLREANQRFSRAMKAVKAGHDVVLTERGVPIAVIKPLKRTGGIKAALRRMAADGRVQGYLISLSETVRADRDARD